MFLLPVISISNSKPSLLIRTTNGSIARPSIWPLQSDDCSQSFSKFETRLLRCRRRLLQSFISIATVAAMQMLHHIAKLAISRLLACLRLSQMQMQTCFQAIGQSCKCILFALAVLFAKKSEMKTTRTKLVGALRPADSFASCRRRGRRSSIWLNFKLLSFLSKIRSFELQSPSTNPNLDPKPIRDEELDARIGEEEEVSRLLGHTQARIWQD